MDENATHLKLAKFSRYLRRISTATRVVGIIIVIAGIIVMLFGIPELLSGRHTEEALAVTLMGLGVGGIGVLVWSTGVFHGGMAHAMVVFGWVDGKLWEMMQIMKQPAVGAAQAAPAHQARATALAPVVDAAQAAPSAEAAAATVAEPVEQEQPAVQVADSGEPGGETSQPAKAEGAAEPEPGPPPPEEPPQPTMRCKHCGGEIPTNVLRCKHCLERV